METERKEGNDVREKQMNKRGEMFRLTPFKVLFSQRHIATFTHSSKMGELLTLSEMEIIPRSKQFINMIVNCLMQFFL